MLEGRRPNSREKAWLSLCAQIPCIVCSHFHDTPDTPAEIHHIAGKTQDLAHLFVLSLCTRHHRVPDYYKPARWVSRHGDGKKAFEETYASEYVLLNIQRDAVAKLQERIV